MAKKAQKKSKEELVQLALDLAAQKGWENVRLGDLADEAGLELAALRGYFCDKSDILVALGRMIDEAVLENIGPVDETESARDRLFDILMERYDALNEYRPGLVAVLDSFKCDPKQAVISLPHLCQSMSRMMEAAGLEPRRIAGGCKAGWFDRCLY